MQLKRDLFAIAKFLYVLWRETARTLQRVINSNIHNAGYIQQKTVFDVINQCISQLAKSRSDIL